MIKSVKIRLLPTKEQEILFRKSCGVARWAYNFFLAENERIYKEWKDGKSDRKNISETEVRRYINNVLKSTTHSWLKEVGSNVMKQGVKDANEAKQRYLKGLCGRPKFKSKKTAKLSFYVNYESLTRQPNGFHGEKIGYVKTATALPKLRKGEKYSNPRISYDGKFWYLSVGYKLLEEKPELTNKIIGIDLGIKDLAICSDGEKFKNINKTKKVKRLEQKLKREQRKLSRKLENNIKSYTSNRKPIFERSLYECKNFQKQKHTVVLINRRLSNIRQNYVHQTTTKIVKSKPSKVVIEDLNVKGIMKNKHLAKLVAAQKFYEFRRQLEYKCAFSGIEIVIADRWYPSSKKCSCCGNIKKDLKLKDRVYKCDICGLVIDRDYNAAVNLSNYESVG